MTNQFNIELLNLISQIPICKITTFEILSEALGNIQAKKSIERIIKSNFEKIQFQKVINTKKKLSDITIEFLKSEGIEIKKLLRKNIEVNIGNK